MSVPSPTAKPVPLNWNGGERVRSYVPMATIDPFTRAMVACVSAAAGAAAMRAASAIPDRAMHERAAERFIASPAGGGPILQATGRPRWGRKDDGPCGTAA